MSSGNTQDLATRSIGTWSERQGSRDLEILGTSEAERAGISGSAKGQVIELEGLTRFWAWGHPPPRVVFSENTVSGFLCGLGHGEHVSG